MKALLVGVSIAILFSCVACSSSVARPPEVKPPKFEVVAYLPEYRMEIFDPEQAKLATDLVYFSAEPTATGELDMKNLSSASLKTLKEFRAKNNLRLFLCVGGGGRSKGFAPMTASPTARANFAKVLVKFCEDNGMDGIDLDWEHPETEAEHANCALMLTEVKEALSARGLILTMALTGWQKLPAEAYAACDRIHLMAYDAMKGPHATPEFAELELARLIEKGIPPEKICLGMPFYGREVKNYDNAITYAEIVEKYHPAPDADEVNGIYFNNITTIQKKTQSAVDHKLAGVMFWEIGQDTKDEKSLLRAIRAVVPVEK